MSEGSHERSRWLYGYLIIVSIWSLFTEEWQMLLVELLKINFYQIIEPYFVHSSSENYHLCFVVCFSELSWRVISGFWNFFPKLTFDRVLVLLQGTFPCKLHYRISQDFKSGCHVEIVSFWGLRSIDLLQ